MKKFLWTAFGVLCVGLAYVGIFVPGMPTTSFAILAAWAFAKSSPRFNKWLRSHKVLGRYIADWESKRIYPVEGKYAMMTFMFISLAFIVMFSPAWVFFVCVALFTAIIVWAWQFPSDEWEYKERLKRKNT